MRLSLPKAAHGTLTSPCPYWVQEGTSAWGLTSSWGELVELGQDGSISKCVLPGDIGLGEGLLGRSACAMFSGMALLSGELWDSTLWAPSVLCPVRVPAETQMAATEVAMSQWGNVPFDLRDGGGFESSGEIHRLATTET